MTRNAEDVFVAGECNVKSYTFWAFWLRICVSSKLLIPPSAFIIGVVSNLLFPFLHLLLYFWPPVFEIHKAVAVKLDMGLIAPAEVNGEW